MDSEDRFEALDKEIFHKYTAYEVLERIHQHCLNKDGGASFEHEKIAKFSKITLDGYQMKLVQSDCGVPTKLAVLSTINTNHLENNLILCLFNSLLLAGKLENVKKLVELKSNKATGNKRGKEEIYLSGMILDISEVATENEMAKKKVLGDYVEAKKNILHKNCAMIRKLQNLAVDINFESNTIQLYAHRPVPEELDLHGFVDSLTHDVDELLNNLGIEEIQHGWIPEKGLIPPRGAASSLRMLMEFNGAKPSGEFIEDESIKTWRKFILGRQLTEEGLERLRSNAHGDEKKPIIVYHNYNFHLVRKVKKVKKDELELDADAELEILNVDTCKWDKLRMRLEDPTPAFKVDSGLSMLSGFGLYNHTFHALRYTARVNEYIQFHTRFANECGDLVPGECECKCSDDEKKKNPLSFVSHNIDGFISWLRKYPCWFDFYRDYDVICLQETKLPLKDVDGTWVVHLEKLSTKKKKGTGEESDFDIYEKFIKTIEGIYAAYFSDWSNYRYFGVLTLVRKDIEVISSTPTLATNPTKFGKPIGPGRFLAIEFNDCIVYNVYSYNVGRGLAASSSLSEVMPVITFIWSFVEAIFMSIQQSKKPILLMGDMNARICTPYIETQIGHWLVQRIFQHWLVRLCGQNHCMFDVHYAYYANKGYTDSTKMCSFPTCANFKPGTDKISYSCRIDAQIVPYELLIRVKECKIYGKADPGEENERRGFHHSNHAPIGMQLSHCKMKDVKITKAFFQNYSHQLPEVLYTNEAANELRKKVSWEADLKTIF